MGGEGGGREFSVELGPDCEEGLEGQAKVDVTGSKVTSPGPPALPSVPLKHSTEISAPSCPQTWDSLTLGSQEERRVFIYLFIYFKSN